MAPLLRVPSFTWSYVASWLVVTIITMFTVSNDPLQRLPRLSLFIILQIASTTLLYFWRSEKGRLPSACIWTIHYYICGKK